MKRPNRYLIFDSLFQRPIQNVNRYARFDHNKGIIVKNMRYTVIILVFL